MKVSDFNVYDWFDIDSEVQQVMPAFIDEVFIDTMPAFCVQPIPLTADILMANGFEHMPVYSVKDRYRLYLSSRYCWVTAARPEIYNFYLVSTDTNIGSFEDIKVEYVHELQHLLRMAGLSDLADDFKLEKGGRQ